MAPADVLVGLIEAKSSDAAAAYIANSADLQAIIGQDLITEADLNIAVSLISDRFPSIATVPGDIKKSVPYEEHLSVTTTSDETNNTAQEEMKKNALDEERPSMDTTSDEMKSTAPLGQQLKNLSQGESVSNEDY